MSTMFDDKIIFGMESREGCYYSFSLDFIAQYSEKAATAGLSSEYVKAIVALSKGKLYTHLF